MGSNCLRVSLALLAGVPLAGCGSRDEDRDRRIRGSETTTKSRSSDPNAASGKPDAGAAGTPSRIRFGDTEMTARLLDNATARALAAQLPLTLSFRDHNDAEETAALPRSLPLDGAPAGHDPTAGDIGYYAPGEDFVLYYDDDAPYFEGIVRIGEFGGDAAAIARLPERADVRIELDD